MQALYPNGDQYAGAHKKGIKNGWGCYLSKRNQIKYQGEWEDNKKQGKGEIMYLGMGKAKFAGIFKDDEPF